MKAVYILKDADGAYFEFLAPSSRERPLKHRAMWGDHQKDAHRFSRRRAHELCGNLQRERVTVRVVRLRPREAAT